MYSVIITSSGSGSRMGLGYNKNLFEVNGEMIIERTINKFINCDLINEIIITTTSEELILFIVKYLDKSFVSSLLSLYVSSSSVFISWGSSNFSSDSSSESTVTASSACALI